MPCTWMTQSHQGEASASFKVYSSELSKKNIAFYIRKTDTCNTCDRLQILINSAEDASTKLELKSKLDSHHAMALASRNCVKQAMDNTNIGLNTLTMTYDLQKTLETPLLQTNVVYYKRQYNTYNFGIHASNKKIVMNVWGESKGKRGSVEISSSVSFSMHRKGKPW